MRIARAQLGIASAWFIASTIFPFAIFAIAIITGVFTLEIAIVALAIGHARFALHAFERIGTHSLCALFGDVERHICHTAFFHFFANQDVVVTGIARFRIFVTLAPQLRLFVFGDFINALVFGTAIGLLHPRIGFANEECTAIVAFRLAVGTFVDAFKSRMVADFALFATIFAVFPSIVVARLNHGSITCLLIALAIDAFGLRRFCAFEALPTGTQLVLFPLVVDAFFDFRRLRHVVTAHFVILARHALGNA